MDAKEPAVSVRTDAEDAGFRLQEALMPGGRLDAASVTGPVAPFRRVMAMEVVAEAPRVSRTYAGEIPSVRPGELGAVMVCVNWASDVDCFVEP